MNIEALKKLAGMRYHGGMYTREQWQEKTGVDPIVCSPLVKVLDNGLCVWTEKAESLYQTYSQEKQFLFAMLTESSFPR